MKYLRRMHILCLTVTIWSILSATAYAQYSAPRIFFTDLESGPNAGGQDNQGAFVTLYGKGFGNTQGASVVTIGGAKAYKYLTWSDTKIAFQIGNAATTGKILVNVSGVNSNSLLFTVRAGNIYFVATSGSDAWPGTYANPWQTLTKANASLANGDIAYAMDGVSATSLDKYGASLAITTSGTSGLPKAIVAYPGATVIMGSASGQTYGIRGMNGSGYWLFAGLTIAGSSEGADLSGAPNWRLVANNVSCPNASGTGACINVKKSSGAKLLGNNIHDAGLASSSNLANYEGIAFSASNNIELAWNQIGNTRGCRAVLFYTGNGYQSGLSVHDNLIHDSRCDAISFASVDPSAGTVRAFNNVIVRAGTGPTPGGTGGLAPTYTCVSVGGSGLGQAGVLDNTLYDCGAQGGTNSGAVTASTPTSITDNIVNAQSGENYVSSNTTTAYLSGSNNLFYGAGGAPAPFTSSVQADPQFVNAAALDFHLQSTSTAINAGANMNIAADYDGVPRGPSYDIGAFQYNGTAASSAGQLTSAPTSLNFGTVTIGSSSTQSVQVSNTGSANATISQISATGSGFTVAPVTLPMTLTPGQVTTLAVSFAPAAAGMASGSVVVTSNAADPTVSVQLSGNGANPASSPYLGTPQPIPGTIYAANYDLGGENVAYSDTTAGNTTGCCTNTYRSDDVDLEPTSDSNPTAQTGNAYNVGSTDTGEWLNYTVNVSTAGTYTVNIRVAAGAQGGAFHLALDGTTIGGALTVPNTGGWQNWTTLSENVALPAGTHVLSLHLDSVGTYNVGNFHYLQFSAGATADTTAPSTSITSPLNGATVSGVVSVTASASDVDSAVSRVEFYVDGALKATDTASPYTYSWDTTQYANASHALSAKAYDPAGNVGTSATVSVTVNNSSSSTSAKLLFKTGFEPNTTLSAFPSGAISNGSSYWLSFSGTDNSTGFSWPFQPWTSGYTGVRVGTINTGDAVSNHFITAIDHTVAHGGSQSLHLKIMNYGNGSCCAWQNALSLASVTQPIREFYERFWMLYPSSYLSELQAANTFDWNSLFYFKSQDDYRWEPDTWITSGATYIRGHNQSDPGGITATCPRFDPVTFVVITTNGNCPAWTFADADNNQFPVPVGQWFLVELYMRRSPNPDGRYAVAINGQVIGDYTGNTAVTFGPYGEDIMDIGFMAQYSSVFPNEKWLDDFELWNTLPCTTFPCGSMALPGAGGGPVVTPPSSITSYGGAVGAVGVPFSYQIKASNSPTSFSGSVPAGLSLNTSTGVISGTPTTATNCSFNGSPTSCQYTYQVYNGSGKTALNMGFYITASLQPPKIPYFWPNPSTISAGQSTQLKWITLGAGTVTLSLSPSVGTVSGPNGTVTVSPTTTTTYTLTATNSAGSVSKSVTVTVQ